MDFPHDFPPCCFSLTSASRGRQRAAATQPAWIGRTWTPGQKKKKKISSFEAFKVVMGHGDVPIGDISYIHIYIYLLRYSTEIQSEA